MGYGSGRVCSFGKDKILRVRFAAALEGFQGFDYVQVEGYHFVFVGFLLQYVQVFFEDVHGEIKNIFPVQFENITDS